MIETESSRKQFAKLTGRANLITGSVPDQALKEAGIVPCPVCEERRRKKAESMKRYRAKKK